MTIGDIPAEPDSAPEAEAPESYTPERKPTEGSETEGEKSAATGAHNAGTPTTTEGSPSGHPDEID